MRTTENILRQVDWRLKEAAFALGAPYHKVILRVVYRKAAPGILTGILLSVSRVTGETAPLLFTSFNNSFFSTDMSQPIASLTVTIYQYTTGPYHEWHQQAWAAAFVIIIVNLLLTIVARYAIRLRYRQQL